MDIGQKIKQLRIKNGLTLNDLASRCELTKGFLSQLERGLTTPSIPTLQDIVEALGITMAKFFQEESDEKVVFTANDHFVDQREGYTVTWIVPNAQKNQMEPILVELNPGEKTMDISPHEGEEFGYITQGKVTLVDGEHHYTVKKGETFYIKGQNLHYMKNNTSQPAKLIWITTPPVF
ncbi:MAG: XRE family transcriptional regulator [Erysipelotrichaceae bacterium]|jgi:transcriptional regulator with XRE-family HTH domain|nr:XRE family transcriptional regulator [Erysipelotrichaceae bacterium]